VELARLTTKPEAAQRALRECRTQSGIGGTLLGAFFGHLIPKADLTFVGWVDVVEVRDDLLFPSAHDC